jgi:predicted GNAT family acetyltransferase
VNEIRLLTESDREDLVRFVMREPEINLYFLGNIRTLGFSSEICECWGSFFNGRLVGALMRYMSGWVIYDAPGADLESLGRILDEHPAGATRLQDNTRSVPSFLPYLRRYRPEWISEETLCVLSLDDFAPPPHRHRAVRATWDDLEDLVRFYSNAEKMTRSRAAVERPLRDGRIFLIRRGDEILSAALTNAEAAGMAMIGGVYTPPRHRNRGYARDCVGALCEDLLKDGLRPVLYYDNPAAGTVYRRLGFRKIGVWRSVALKPKS